MKYTVIKNNRGQALNLSLLLNLSSTLADLQEWSMEPWGFP